jgi:DNA-binding transcriptional LysR family regulator
MRMQLRALRAFVEVVRQGGFSQAAKVVFATQSTVSKAVKQLEDEIGVPLLDRIGHRSVLTVAGEVVFRRALKMLAEQDDLAMELSELQGLKRGTLRLGLPALSSNTFASLFAVYRERYPGIDVRLVEHGSGRLEELLRAGDIDIAASLLPVSDDFEWQEVQRERLMVLISAGHALARVPGINLHGLKDQPFLLVVPDFALNRLILHACQKHGFDPTVAARSSQVDFIVELVATGLGIAFLPQSMAEKHNHPSIRRIPLEEPDSDWQLVMIWRRGAFLSHAAQAWLAIWRETHSTK